MLKKDFDPHVYRFWDNEYVVKTAGRKITGVSKSNVKNNSLYKYNQ